MSISPTISIITIVYNGADLLQATIDSVAIQTYAGIEYILVDGASTDGSIQIIKNNERHISKWVSENDNGLYDAMNKGLKMASGDFIWFLNCGDHIYKKDTVEKMVQRMAPNTDLMYGEVMLVNEERKELGTRSQLSTQKLPEKLTWKSLRYGMVVSHQAFLPKRSIAPLYIENNLTADIDWVIKCLKKSKYPLHTHLVLATYLMGGLSKQRHHQSMKDRYAVLEKHYGKFNNILNHAWILTRSIYRKLSGKQSY